MGTSKCMKHAINWLTSKCMKHVINWLKEKMNVRKVIARRMKLPKFKYGLLMTHGFIDNSTLLQSAEGSGHEFLVGH